MVEMLVKRLTKHVVKLLGDKVQASPITTEVVFFGPGRMVEVRFCSKRIQHPNLTPEWAGVRAKQQ